VGTSSVGRTVVGIDLPEVQMEILKGWISARLWAGTETLEEAEDTATREIAIRSVVTAGRLSCALDRGTLRLPDPDALAMLETMAASFDRIEGYEEVVATHDAYAALIAIFRSGCPQADPSGVPTGRRPDP